MRSNIERCFLKLCQSMQDADIIPECEWLAAIYQSRRQHEVDFYGWQSCDEIQDPESGRREDVLSHKSSQYFRSI
jgi:hypothetical protein